MRVEITDSHAIVHVSGRVHDAEPIPADARWGDGEPKTMMLPKAVKLTYRYCGSGVWTCELASVYGTRAMGPGDDWQHETAHLSHPEQDSVATPSWIADAIESARPQGDVTTD